VPLLALHPPARQTRSDAGPAPVHCRDTADAIASIDQAAATEEHELNLETNMRFDEAAMVAEVYARMQAKADEAHAEIDSAAEDAHARVDSASEDQKARMHAAAEAETEAEAMDWACMMEAPARYQEERNQHEAEEAALRQALLDALDFSDKEDDFKTPKRIAQDTIDKAKEQKKQKKQIKEPAPKKKQFTRLACARQAPAALLATPTHTYYHGLTPTSLLQDAHAAAHWHLSI